MSDFAQPPVAEDAECVILGCLLMDPEICETVAEILEPEDFYSPSRRVVYQAILEVWDGQYPPDPKAVMQILHDSGDLEKIGGADVIVGYAEAVSSSAVFMSSCKIIKDTRRKRDILYHLKRQLRDVESASVSEAVEVYEGSVRSFDAEESKADSIGAGSQTQAILDAIKAGPSEDDKGIPSGFTAIDSLTGGFHRGEMTIIGGRPGMGKSSLAYNFCLKASVRGYKVGIFSLEVSQRDIDLTLHGIIAGCSLREIRDCEADPGWIAAAGESLKDRTVEIFDTVRLTPKSLRSKARRMKRRHGLDLMVIDYLQLMTTGKKTENRQQEVSEISREIKNLTRELDCHAIALTQLNRGVENREDRRPRMSDIRESGSIEQDAENIMFVYRDEVYNPIAGNRGHAELIVAKQRNGSIGKVALLFDGRTKRFSQPGPSLMPRVL